MPKILIIDEIGFTRRITRKSLCRDHEVTEAANGLQALDVLVGEDFDCIVTEIRMPVMSGFELLQRLDDQGSQTPVVVLTEDLRASTAQFCDRHGAFQVCHKPIDADEIRTAVAQAMAESRCQSGTRYATDAPHGHSPICSAVS